MRLIAVFALLALNLVALRFLEPAREAKRPVPDLVRLLDHLETSTEIDTPPVRASHRAKRRPIALAPPWETLDGRADLSITPVVGSEATFVRVRPVGGESLSLRWHVAIEPGVTYDVTAHVGLALTDEAWTTVLDRGTLRTAALASVRVRSTTNDAARAPGARLRATPTPPIDEPRAVREGDDPLRPLRQLIAGLDAKNYLAPLLAGPFAKLDEHGDGIFWLPTSFRFTAPADASTAILGLDLAGVVAALPVQWTMRRAVPARDLAPPPGTLARYSRVHGDTALVKRMIESDRDHRLSLALAPDSTVGIDTTFPADGTLRVGLRATAPRPTDLPTGDLRTGDPRTASRLAIEAALAGGERVVLHEETIPPMTRADPWLDRVIPLGAAAGRTGRIRFRVTGPPTGVGVAVADPILSRRARGETTPSLLLITVDSLCADHVGPHGGRPSLTPRIDAFRRQGVSVTHAIAGGLNTFSSMPSLMTAQPAFSPRAGAPSERPAVDVPTVAEAMADAGRFVHAIAPDYYLHCLWKGFHQRTAGPLAGPRPFDDDDRIARAIAFLESHASDPFFLWIHLDDPHLPCLPRAADALPWAIPGVADPGAADAVARWNAAAAATTSDDAARRRAAEDYLHRAYCVEVGYADRRVGRLLDAVDRLGLAARTAVAVHADHGLRVTGDKVGFRDMTDATVRVPLAVRYPPSLPAGATRHGVMSMVDLAPTLFDLLGVPAPEAWVGESRAAWLRGDAALTDERTPFDRGYAVVRYLDRAVIRTGTWRYETPLGTETSADGAGPILERYAADGAGTIVPADRHAAVVEALRARIDDAIRRGQRAFIDGGVSRSLRGFLRESGYLSSGEASSGAPPK